MTTGTSSFMGLGMGLSGEYELTQVTAATDTFTITGVSGASGVQFVIQDSAKLPATNGFRVYDYGRTRLIRTDASAHGGAYKNALDVKYDIDYAMGGVQAYAATFILDIAGGSCSGGRQSVIQLQSYGNTTSHSGQISSWILCTDLGATETVEIGCFLHVQGSTIAAGNMLRAISNPDSGYGLVMYWDNTMYFIMVADNSG